MIFEKEGTDASGEITDRALREELNRRPFKKFPGSRLTMFESLDKPALKPLPAERYVYAEWKKARVNIDYHVEVEGNYYSVPYQLFGREVDVRLTGKTVECFHKGIRVSGHQRSSLHGRHPTVKEHMPKAHQSYAGWTPERVIRWGGEAGPATRQVGEWIPASRLHPQQGFRSSLVVIRLGKIYGAERLEAASKRALRYQATTYGSIKAILKAGLDRQPLEENRSRSSPIEHHNIRVSRYYEGETEC